MNGKWTIFLQHSCSLLDLSVCEASLPFFLLLQLEGFYQTSCTLRSTAARDAFSSVCKNTCCIGDYAKAHVGNCRAGIFACSLSCPSRFQAWVGCLGPFLPWRSLSYRVGSRCLPRRHSKQMIHLIPNDRAPMWLFLRDWAWQ